MSHYIYTCVCCGTCWDSTSTGRKPTKAELARMVCQPCREAPRRIAALEAENASLREDKARLVDALEEIADGDGCNCRVGPGCDWKCKDIARTAIDAAKQHATNITTGGTPVIL